MSADLRSLLDQAAGDPRGVPDFDALARRGRARRGHQRAARVASGLAAVAVIAVIGGQLVTDSRPSVLLDSPPKPGAGAWELVADAPLEPAEGAEAVDLGDGTVLVVGGTIQEPGRLDSTPQAAIYDVDARTWTPLPPVPFALNPDGESNVGAVRARATGDGRAVAWREWGGPGPGPGFEAALLDPVAGRWLETGAAPLRPRQHPVVEWIDGRLVVWGGLHRDEPDTETWPGTPAEALDAQSDRAEPVPGGAVWSPEGAWRTMSAAPLDARFDHATEVVDGRLVIWGGTDGGVHVTDRRLFADGAVYDVATDRWDPLPDAGLAGRSIPAIVPEDGGFIIAGGQGHVAIEEMTEVPAEGCGSGVECAGRSYHPEVFADGARYDLGDGTWAPLTVAPAGVEQVSAHAGTLYGAHDQPFYAYDSDRDVWTETPPGPEGWPWTGVVLGQRVVALTEVEMLDPVRVRLGGAVFAPDVGWTPLAEADTPARTGAAVTAVGDEAVFVWGGVSDTNPRGDGRHRPTFHADGAVWRPSN